MVSNTELNSWFESLHESKKQDLVVLKKPQYNFFDGVIDKYRDSAHFIYELLQNADDAKATEVEMVLTKDHFIFTHNGAVKFTVSDPKTEVEDRKNGRLGHINAIVGVGFSSKSQKAKDESEDINDESNNAQDVHIGKFGVGFKAVFQYTTTPYIYDNPFCFKIEDYIVPTRLEDTSLQKEGKTVFIIPFDRKDMTAERAYMDIEQKLSSLEYPQLFLFNVQTISWETPTNKDRIEKKRIKQYGSYKGIDSVLYEIGDLKEKKKEILLMSRMVDVPKTDQKYTISIGYLFDDEGRIDTDTSIRKKKLNCFFPTQDCFDTCYLIHAPFMLIDSREHIKCGDDINISLIKSVGKLAADSIVVLKELSVKNARPLLGDNIFDLIHHDSYAIRDIDYRLYNIFNDCYKEILDHEPVFLSRQKKYITKDFGWWSDAKMRELLTSKDLNRLLKCDQKAFMENEDDEIRYDFILCSVDTYNGDMNKYEIHEMSDTEFAKKLNTRFLNAQGEDWLSELFEYILDNKLIEEKYFRGAPMRNAHIIKNECNEFVAPYDGNDLCVFFEKDDGTDSKYTINNDLYKRNEQFRKLLKKLGVKEPSDYDKIRIQLKKLDKKVNTDLLSFIIKYNNRCNGTQLEELHKYLYEELVLFCCKTVNSCKGGEDAWFSPKDMIADDAMLIEYYDLSGLEGKHYIDRDYYKAVIEGCEEEKFNRFFKIFNLPLYPAVITEEVSLREDEWGKIYRYEALSGNKYGKDITTLEGVKNVLEKIESSDSRIELSHYLWKALIHHIDNHNHIFKKDSGIKYCYKGRNPEEHSWDTCTLVEWLRKYQWLYVDDKFQSLQHGLYKEDLLRAKYESNDALFSELGIESMPIIAERECIKQMSPETQGTFELGLWAEKRGMSIEDLEEMCLLYEQRHVKAVRPKIGGFEDYFPKRRESEKFSDADFSVADNANRVETNNRQKTKESVNIAEALAGFDEKANLEREEIERVMFLREQAENHDKYSYGWLKTLMELEARSNGEKSASGKRSIYIHFERVMADTERVNRIVLSSASRSISSMLEDIDGIPVTFNFRNGDKQIVVFDNASVKEDALIVRGNASSEPQIRSVVENLSHIGSATIDVDKPIELIKGWRSLINKLPFELDKDSVKNNLRRDLKFIFGPPGTGKTTTLAHRIIKLMEKNDRCRILVLAPTNKACDILAKKVLELEPVYNSWLWRFVSTMDSYLEAEEIVCQRDADILSQNQMCVVSTVARYSFDGFNDGLLNALDWDYVIIDEASMIPLYQILPIIYNEHSSEIWIAGDPFQIEPIVNIDLWKDENIYKMIDLKDFENHKTTPVQFDVEPLMTQYRSIPVIGEVYSQYKYHGKLRHARSNDSHRVLNMGLKESPLNVISFPVNKDSIFDLRRLVGSNIQIYSVLFTVEFLIYISSHLAEDSSKEPIKIGVLSPYSVEIQSIQKLYEQTCKPYANVSVNFGTSHGFQGDQCDIVIAVMNPPSSGLKRSSELTFINKPNILNVAISRAKDYLFLLMPEKSYELFPMLHELKKLGKIMVSTKCNNFYTSDEIEKVMFGKIHHIEDNTYVTTHQTTNIYSGPLAKYEVRIGEQALDIQINEIEE